MSPERTCKSSNANGLIGCSDERGGPKDSTWGYSNSPDLGLQGLRGGDPVSRRRSTVSTLELIKLT